MSKYLVEGYIQNEGMPIEPTGLNSVNGKNKSGNVFLEEDELEPDKRKPKKESSISRFFSKSERDSTRKLDEFVLFSLDEIPELDYKIADSTADNYRYS